MEINWDTFKKVISFKISCCYSELVQEIGQYLDIKIGHLMKNQNTILLYLQIQGKEIKKLVPLTPEENNFLIKVKDTNELRMFFDEIEEELYCEYSENELSDSDIEMVENMNDRVKRIKR